MGLRVVGTIQQRGLLAPTLKAETHGAISGEVLGTMNFLASAASAWLWGFQAVSPRTRILAGRCDG